MSTSFSIIVPVYNGEKYIVECLNSLVKIRYDSFEIIIVNDGSIDNTLSILNDFAKKSSAKIKIINIINQGTFIARNVGVLNAVCDYILFVDADDKISQNALTLIDKIIGKTNVDIVSFNFALFDSENFKYQVGQLKSGLYSDDLYNNIKARVCSGKFNSIWGKAIKRTCINSEDYYKYKNFKFGEDLFQLLPIIDNAKSLYHIEEVLYFYRKSEDSCTTRFSQSKVDDVVMVNRQILKYGLKWGENGKILRYAFWGEIGQYLYLLKINKLSSTSQKIKEKNFMKVREVMESEGVLKNLRNKHLRLDKMLQVKAIKFGNMKIFNIVNDFINIFLKCRQIFAINCFKFK